MPPQLALLLLAAAARTVAGIVVSAPDSCGGLRVVPHTRALFGPALRGSATARPVFAPAPRTLSRAWWPLRFWRARSDRIGLSDACVPLGEPARLAARDHVVLVARGKCDFAAKTAALQDAGAIGVVIVNGRDTSQLVNMKLNESLVDAGRAPNISIPTAMIQFADWARFARCRANPALSITMSLSGQAVNDIDYGRDALVWAIMRGMALWILCQCGGNVFSYKRRATEFRARATTIAALPEEVFRREVFCAEGVGDAKEALLGCHDRDDDDPICAVCLDNIEPGDRVRRLACRHLYHRECIDP